MIAVLRANSLMRFSDNKHFLSFQRYRYSEAYQVDQILQNLEQEFISKNSVSEDVLSRMKSVSRWRAGLIVSGFLRYSLAFMI